jgi:tetratricopeptide (TPR) repeat protein
VVPHPLVLDYFEWPIGSGEWLAPWVAGATLLGAGTVWLFLKKPALGFLGVWFFVILAPTSSVVPIVSEVAAERRMYLPLAAVVTAVVMGAWWLLQQVFAEREGFPELLAKVLSVAALIACVGLTILRNSDYATEERVWLDTVEKIPSNPRARNNLGIVYAERREFDAALEQFEEALRLKPLYPDGLFNYGNALAQSGRLKEAIEQFRFALRLRPTMATAHSNLGVALANSGSLAEALPHHEEAVRLLPNSARAHFNRAETLLKMGARTEAKEGFQRAASLVTAADAALGEQIRKRLEELESASPRQERH